MVYFSWACLQKHQQGRPLKNISGKWNGHKEDQRRPGCRPSGKIKQALGLNWIYQKKHKHWKDFLIWLMIERTGVALWDTLCSISCVWCLSSISNATNFSRLNSWLVIGGTTKFCVLIAADIHFLKMWN